MTNPRKEFFLILLALAVMLPHQLYAGQPGFVHDITVQLFPDTHHLEATCTISWATDEQPPSRFILAPQAEILDVTVDSKDVEVTFKKGMLNILQNERRPGKSIEVHYRVLFNDPLPTNTVGIEDPSFGVSATISPAGTYLSEGTYWFPRSPGRHTYKVKVGAPAGIYGVTAGRLIDHGTVEQTTYTQWQTDFPLNGLALSAGQYQVFQGKDTKIQALAFLTDKNGHLAETYLNAIETYLEIYQEILGPYPFRKFAVVENFLPTGYGMPSWTLLGSNVVSLPFIPYTSLPHEIVHSWWGNAIEVDYSQGNWAEGLTTYLADYLLKERKSQQEAVDYRRKILREYASLVTAQNDFAISAFRGRNNKAQQAIGYGKTAMVFHMLRQKVGEETFWRVVYRLASENRGKQLGWDDFEQAFEAESGLELSRFFQQWVEQPGAPDLTFSEVTITEEKEGWKVHGVVEQSGPLFTLDLPIRIETETDVVHRSLPIDKEQTPFSISLPAKPLSLTGDPDTNIFRRLATAEQPATINDLRASKDLLVVSRKENDPLFKASRDLLRGFRKMGAKSVVFSELTPAMAADKDLLFIGWPGKESFNYLQTMHLGADQDFFSWQEIIYNDKDDALFLIRKRADSGHVVALFHPLSADGARKVSRKIPHYGRYSDLTFRKGQNTFKGTDEPLTSPLKVDLSSLRSSP
jgi:hypothetical protein